MPSPGCAISTTEWGSASAGARGFIRAARTWASTPKLRPDGPTRSSWSAREDRTPPWSSTATSRLAGVSTGRQQLPSIFHRKEYEAGLESPPDYRLTCIFVDRNHRHEGVAAVAAEGALDLIAQAGGGVVEAYPQDTAGKKISASFLYSATRGTFEKAGFDYERPKGKNHCVMRTIVPPA
jgi:hypothetical protein